MTKNKDVSFTIHEMRQVTLLIGNVANSNRAVYAYIDHSEEMIEKLLEENPNWIHEELAKYPWVYTEGAIILRSNKLRTYRIKDSLYKQHNIKDQKSNQKVN